MIIESKHGHRLLEFNKISTIDALSNASGISGGHAVLLHKGKLIVCWNKYRNNWELPGGGRNQGEILSDCVKREIKEDINQEADDLRIQGISKVYIPRMKKEILWAVFKGSINQLNEFTENEEMSKMTLWDFKSYIGDMDEVDMKIVEIILNEEVVNHYDLLVDENNDPVNDSTAGKAYMDKWDGQAFIDEMRLIGKEDVLEIGVGTGRLAVRICDKCRSFTGIDISPKTIERTKENLRNFQNVSLICGDFPSYSFNESFDVIYSSLTFMHIKDKKAAVQKAAKLLNPDGWFVLSIDKNQQTEIDYGNREIAVYPDTAEEIDALITEAGLNIEKQFETEFAKIFTALKG